MPSSFVDITNDFTLLVDDVGLSARSVSIRRMGIAKEFTW